MQDFNICAFGTDSYKHSHHPLLPEGTEVVYSYGEARVGGQFKEITFFGLQYIIGRYLTGQVVTREKIEEAAAFCKGHFGNEAVFNRKGWEHILAVHGGKLPIRIRALPEGTTVPEGTALFTIENTDPEVPWLTNFLETLIMQVWSPTTVCTGSREVKKIIARYLEETGDPAGLSFKLHDFGYRGVSSLETAALAGAAHLVNFMGTDTLAAMPLLRDYYGIDTVPGFSIPATEHSIMTSRGPEGEADVVRKILATYPTGLVAMVIDSYDAIGFIKNVIGGNPDILETIRNRQGTVVFRPDSGSLPEIDIKVFNALEEVFGSETNPKGYRVLPPYVRMIQGDGIKWLEGYLVPTHTVEDILAAFKDAGISADNIAFGSGGGLLQAFNRDTCRFAIKCSAMQINGEWVDIFKQPKTDPTKNSKRGRLVVVRSVSGKWVTTSPEHLRSLQSDASGNYHEGSIFQNYMTTKFLNGEMVRLETFDQIRELAKLGQTGPHYALKD
jgi:nicotinamide phosphoribosyltransferase